MMRRIMIIPAAGAGSRLGATVPKLMVPVNGRPMLDHLVELYTPVVDEFFVVVSPAAETRVRNHIAGLQASISIAVQQTPSGMLDAIMIPLSQLESARPLQAWISWCDQVAVLPATVQRLAQAAAAHPQADLVLPTMQCKKPYIHFERDAGGTICNILHQREGDAMPETGESDMGLFVLSDHACFDMLPRYAAEVEPGEGTGERNFLPFVVWAGRHGDVHTITGTHPMESVGINTPEELERVERWLQDD
jgi:bifunctional N-acetylglucosamine-1-phosphate-uridyltransferase/glucosamine-1-phosphate-acetyltransferase GlmU-like protein